jgi:alkylhydroperoxidase family enzyme
LAAARAIAERDTDPSLLAVARARVRWLLRLAGAPMEPSDDRGRAVASFVDQFVVDVAGTTDAQRSALFGALGNDTLEFVQALFVVDLTTRDDVLRPRLLPGDWPADDVVVAADETLWPALETYLRTVARLHALDPLTSELVRLRGAATHACRLCRSRRAIDALDALDAADASAGADLLALAERFESSDLDPRRKIALRVVDAMLTQPTELADATVAAARDAFSVDELDELLLDVVRNAANKIAVAFGADAPQVSAGVEYYTIDAAGDVVAAADADLIRSYRG